MFLTSSNLSSLPAISHGFFTRNGGTSNGIYHSLNCGAGTKDEKAHVIENRARVATALSTDTDKLLSLHQIHSADVVTVTESWNMENRPQADAMVTNRKRMALGILTADCVPVLLYDKENYIIGAAHAGWKGALSGIVEETLKAMGRLGAKNSSIAAAIGPAIAQRSYEVDAQFREKFMIRNPLNAVYFVPSPKPAHFLFDLKQFVYDALAYTGIMDINMLENDTYLEENMFFSYRRATHRGEADYGRQISAIMLKP
jgi:YfiH family protein